MIRNNYINKPYHRVMGFNMVTTALQKRELRKRIQQAWYGNVDIPKAEGRVKKGREIEEYGLIILRKEGFTDIIPMHYQFPVDAFATDKNGKRWLIDITGSYLKASTSKSNKSKEILKKETGYGLLILFIKPDKSAYYFKELKGISTSVSVAEIEGYKLLRKDKIKINPSILFGRSRD